MSFGFSGLLLFGEDTLSGTAQAGVPYYLSTPTVSNSTIASVASSTLAGDAYGAGAYLIAGDSKYYRSTDGVNWSTYTYKNAATGAGAIAFVNGLFIVTFGSNRKIHSSADGLTWNEVTAVGSAGDFLGEIAFGAGVYVVAVRDASSNSFVLTATDPAGSWTRTSTGQSFPNSIGKLTFGGGVFIATLDSAGANSSYMTSSNGTSWTLRTLPRTKTISSLKAFNGYALLLENDLATAQKLYKSTDGINWTECVVPSHGYSWLSVGFTSDRYALLAAGTTGVNATIAVSKDLTTWNSSDLGTTDDLTFLASGNGDFIAATRYCDTTTEPVRKLDLLTRSGTLTSVTASNQLAGTAAAQSTAFLVTPWGGNAYAAASTVSASLTTQIRFSASIKGYASDSDQWVAISQPSGAGGSPPYANAHYGTEGVVLLGDNGHTYFSDTNYYPATLENPYFFNVDQTIVPYSSGWRYAYGGTTLVARNATTIAYGTHPLVWSGQTTLPDNGGTVSFASPQYRTRQIVYGAGLFLVTSDTYYNGRWWWATSPDGVTWTLRSEVGAEGKYFTGLIFANGKFINIARKIVLPSVPSDAYRYSTNGTTWTWGTLPKVGYWSGLAGGNGVFLAYEDSTNNQLARSTNGIDWAFYNLPVTLPSGACTLEYANGVFMLNVDHVTTPVCYFSYDGIDWFERDIPVRADSFVPHSRGFYALGGSGYYRFTPAKTYAILTAPQGSALAATTLAATSVVSGALTTSIRLNAVSTASSTASVPTLLVPTKFFADATATSSASAGLTTTIRLSATASAEATGSGTVTQGLNQLVAAAEVTPSVTASLSATIKLASIQSCSSTATASLSATIKLAADIKAQGSYSAPLTTAIRLSGALVSSQSISGSVEVRIQLAASAGLIATAQSSLTRGVRLRATVASGPSIEAYLSLRKIFASSVSSIAKSTSSLSASIRLSKQLVSNTSAYGSLTTSITAHADAVASTGTSASLITKIFAAGTLQCSQQASASLSFYKDPPVLGTSVYTRVTSIHTRTKSNQIEVRS